MLNKVRCTPGPGFCLALLALCMAGMAVDRVHADSGPARSHPLGGENVGTRGRLLPEGLRQLRAASSDVIPGQLNGPATGPPSGSEATVILPIGTPPEICYRTGTVNSISFTDFEGGLGSWTVGTRDVANESTFDTPDWAVVGSLPDSRSGQAAFVPNLDQGNCSTDDESGVVYMTSAAIDLPGSAKVPRIAFHHWFEFEEYWDGGNLELSVNGGEFQLIPTSAIEFNPYNSRLFGDAEASSNPLGGQPAYSGSRRDTGGSWEEVRINLTGLANARDTVRIRFEFGLDGCGGALGWYVDDVRVYSCSEELPPSDCGNGVLDPGEKCDDGNSYSHDGCSNICRVEETWICTDPLPPGVVMDPGFELGTPNPEWSESSTNFGTPICDEQDCGLGTGSGPASGDYWAWFGGIEVYEESSLAQTVTIPTSATNLVFELEASACDSISDYLEVLIDGEVRFFITGSSLLCGFPGYVTLQVDVSAYADGGTHSLEFHGETFGVNLDVTNFFVDDVAIQGTPSECSVDPAYILFVDGFEGG